MAECSEIEAGGEVRTIKDATARNGVATNAAAIAEIVAKIPASASSSNKMATRLDIPNINPSTGIADCNSIFYGLTYCGNNVSNKPIADQSGILLSFMSGTIQNPIGIQIFIPYNGYGVADFYFRDNSNAFSPWRKLTGQII